MNTKLTGRQIAGIGLLVLAHTTAWVLDNVGERNLPRTLVAHYQGATEVVVPDKNYSGVIDEVVSLLEGNPDFIVRIVSHTGTKGDAEANMAMSVSRVAVAWTELTQRGIAPERIQMDSVGEEQPVPREQDETDAMWQKRLSRTEFYVEVPQ